MRFSTNRLGQSRLLLVAFGISLGYLARLVLGAPETDVPPTRLFNSPVTEPETIDLPLINYDGKKGVPQQKNKQDYDEQKDSDPGDDSSGIVPAISLPQLPGLTTFSPSFDSRNATYVNFVDYANDTNSLSDSALSHSAIFEPHGDQVCASGCALSRHPTGKLSESNFRNLIKQFSDSDDARSSIALEELLFYGPQSRKMLATHGTGELPSGQAEYLVDQLRFTHSTVSIRVTDQQGVIRTWLDPTRVPFDHRHIFEMETKNLQPLVTSGTLKRVGLNHVWLRL